MNVLNPKQSNATQKKAVQPKTYYLRDYSGREPSYQPMPLSVALEAHLQRLLGWIRCEWPVNSQIRVSAETILNLVENSHSEEEIQILIEKGNEHIRQKIEKLREIPKAVLAALFAMEIFNQQPFNIPGVKLVEKNEGNQIIHLKTILDWFEPLMENRQNSENQPPMYIKNGVKQLRAALDKYFEDNQVF